MFLPAEGFVSGGGGNLVIIGLKLGAVKTGAAECRGEPLLFLLILRLLTEAENKKCLSYTYTFKHESLMDA